MRDHDAAFRVSLCGLLLALMLVLGYVESLVPVGIPGLKLGLSNGVLIFAVYMLDLPAAWILMGLKVLLSGLLFSGVSAMMYALAGGALSLALMSLLSRIRRLPPTAVSMAGGLAHNVGQVVMAMLVLHSPRAILGYMGLLMLVGLVCGALTGIAATAVMRHLRAGRFHQRLASRRGSLPAVLLAVAVIAAVGLFAFLRLPKTGTVVVTSDAPAMLPADRLPFDAPDPTQGQD